MSDRRFFVRVDTQNRYPGVGQQCPVFDVKDVRGLPVVLGRTLVAGRATLLMFMDVDNPASARLLSTIQSVTAREGVDVVLISRAAGHDDHAGSDLNCGPVQRRDAMRHVISGDIVDHFGVEGQPCGVLLNPQGIIVARGACTARRHIEKLFKTQRRGYYSLYGYLSRISRYTRPVYELR